MTTKQISPEKQITILKNAVLFMLASMHHHDLIDDAQHKKFVNDLKDIGVSFYVLKDYQSTEPNKKPF